MQLSFKLLPWILLSSIVSVFGLAGNTNTLDDYLPKNISVNDFFSPNSTHDEISHSNNITKTIQPNIHKATNYAPKKSSSNTYPLVKQPPVYNSFDKIWFSPNPIATKESLTSSNPFSTISLSGIDGTGGPKPTPPTGIDGTGGPQPIPSQGIEGTGGPSIKESIPERTIIAKTNHEIVSYGKLQQVNNCFVVNSITFCPTNETETILDGNKAADTTSLSNGQVILIKGNADEFNNGIAERVIYTTQISGAITHITKDSITVLKQQIIFHEDIIIGGTATLASELKLGDTINVSGFTLSNGDLSATRIDRVDNNTNKLTGPISRLDKLNKTFSINQLTVDYSQVTVSPTLANGVIVSIKGSINTQNQSTLDIESIEIADSILDTKDTNIQIEGFITEYTNASNFKVGNITIYTDLQTEFIGDDRDDLALDRKIEVEGFLSKDGNVLTAKRITFGLANLTSHKDRSVLSGSTETFKWSNVNAKAYRLVILYSGHNGVFYDETFEGDTTSKTITGLPQSTAFFQVQLYTKQGEFWSRKLYLLFGSGTASNAVLTSHKNGDSLKSSTATFTWSQAPDAKAYRLRIFDYPTNATYYEKIFSKPEAVTLNNLPTNGADINIELLTLHNDGWWSRNPYTLTSIKLVENATITSHINGSQLTSSRETFTWKDVNADKYELRITSRRADGSFSTDEKMTFDGSTTSVTLNNLPINGSEIFIRLRTGHSIIETGLIGWATKNYSFTGVAIIPNAELTSHLNKGTLSSSTEVFSWTEVPEAEEYHLRIYNHVVDGQPRFSENYNSFITTQTIEDLPKNSALMLLILSTKHNGYWAHKKYRLNGTGELPDAKLTSHNDYYTDRKVIKTSSITLTWDDVNADGYFLHIQDDSERPRTTLHKQVYGPETTSVVIEDLPKNTKIFIGLATKHGKWWGSNTISLITDIP